MLHVIGIGASAGGLEALNQFFKHCPEDTGMTFVIIQHLSPDYKSMMPELLSRSTKMPTRLAAEEIELQPNHIYLIPSDKNIILKGQKLVLLERTPRHLLNLPIDVFFESLANELKDQAIGIVLSGTGSDGTIGAQAIKDAGGTMFVQAPDSAQFDGMPLSLIENSLADFVLAAREMAVELNDFIKTSNSFPISSILEIDKETEAIQQILQILKTNLHRDFFLYRTQTLARRILKRIKLNRLNSIQEYIDFLLKFPVEQKRLSEDFLIGVTKFFRDTELFDIFNKKVVEQVIDQAYSNNEEVKGWVVGCSTGEEAYSIAILIEEYFEKQRFRIPYKIFATDIDPNAVDQASKGIYGEDINVQLSEERLHKYFIQQNRSYLVRPKIRRNIIFSRQNILENPPFNGMNFVCCRNMLIYLNSEAQQKALRSLHFATKLEGFMFLGSSESIGSLDNSFDIVDQRAKIFKNIIKASTLDRDQLHWGVSKVSILSNLRSSSLYKEANSAFVTEVLLEILEAASILVDERGSIIHAYGNLRNFISFPEKGFSNNLLHLLPPEFAITVRAGIRILSEGPKPAPKNYSTEIKAIVDNTMLITQIRVDKSPKTAKSESNFYLVTLKEASRKAIKVDYEEDLLEESKLMNYVTENRELKQALEATHQNLQMTIEELETYNEEIQVANEELIASNEELQSTNEELQSVNEELHTVNTELIEKNIQLNEANADMDNFINSLHIGTVFLDKAFCIRRFTPFIEQQIPLEVSDIGKPIQNFSWPDKQLLRDSQKVLKTLQPIRKEVQNSKGIWYQEQILPYRTQEDEIKGVLINFINIDSLKNTSSQLEHLNKYFQQIIHLSPGVIFLHHLDTNLTEEVFFAEKSPTGFTRPELEALKGNIFPNIIYHEDLLKFQETINGLKNLKKGENRQETFRFRKKEHPDEFLYIQINFGSFEQNNEGETCKVIGYSQDVSSLTIQRQEKEYYADLFEKVSTLAPGIIYIYDIDAQKNVYVSKNMSFISGHTPEELEAMGDHVLPSLILEEDLPKAIAHHAALSQAQNNQSLNVDYRIRHKNNYLRWLRSTDRIFERNEKGTVTKIIGLAQDITEEKEQVLEIEHLNNFLENINQVVPSIIYVFDLATYQNIYLAGSVSEILGFSVKEIKASKERIVKRFLVEEYLEIRDQQIQKIVELNNDETQRVEVLAQGHEGTIWLELAEKIFERDEHGKPTKIIGMATSIQELKENEAEQEADLKLFESLHQLSIFSSQDSVQKLEEILETLRIYFGTDFGVISRIEGEEYSIQAGVPHQNWKPVKTKLKLADTFCNFTIQKDGVVALDDISKAPPYNNHPFIKKNNVKSYIGKRLDIDQELFGALCFWNTTLREKPFSRKQIKMMETLANWFSKILERQRIQEELENLVAQLQQSNHDLERFNYIASHDLKEPLNSIISVIDLLRIEIPEENEHLNKLFNIFEESTDRMKKLIDDLLSHALLGQGEFLEEEIDLNALMQLIQEDLKDQITTTDTSIEYDTLPVILGESTNIQLLLQNLISNGIKYNKNKPKIQISVEEQPKQWQFSIMDNGIGIAQKDHQSLFELFKKLHPRSKYPGSGIGLANCKRIVQKHGGNIWVESSLGKGAIFYFTILKPAFKKQYT